MVALYLRASGLQPGSEGAIGRQEQLGLDFARRLGLPTLVYVDTASDANMDRPALNSLISDIESGKVSAVWVGDVTRISRRVVDFGRFGKLLVKHGVKLYVGDHEFRHDDRLYQAAVAEYEELERRQS